MDIKILQEKINKCFTEHFGYTPLVSRLDDIENECQELMKWTDIKNLKEETGHLLTSTLQLCNENGFDPTELIQNTIKTIEGRAEQYKSLGRKVNVAILGLAGNPIHLGHIQLAQFVLNVSRKIDEVWLMPSYDHMQKNSHDMVSAEHRLEMCKLAAKVDKRIKVFDYEIANKLGGETYYLFKKLKEEKNITIENNTYPADKFRFYMIIGIDNANKFHTWVNFTELEKLAKFIVVPRKGVDRDYSVDWYTQKPHIFLNNETPIIDVSSTEIRDLLNKPIEEQISNGQIFKYLDQNVFNYITEYKLYNYGK
jgi:nicotinate-nucleotide adenylyltransferase